MDKHKIQLSDSVTIGNMAPTALNVLIGLNTTDQYRTELEKVEILNNSALPISIVTDLSTCILERQKELWRHIANNSRFVAGTVNFSVAMLVCKQFLKKKITSAEMLAILAKHLSPIRPGRKFKRYQNLISTVAFQVSVKSNSV